jgi:two-component system cell cycle sensor histidine kinase/response regulator CckA
VRDPLRLLLVEDSPTDAKLVILALEKAGRAVAFERVDTREAMRSALARQTWDVVVSDWSMPNFSAPAALALLKELAIDLPFIISSGTVGEEHAVEAMRAGAHDYVLKGNLARLGPAVEREVRELATRHAHRQAEVARREAQLRFKRLFESRITGITVATMAGLITEANDTFLEMVGYSRGDLRSGGLDWMALTPPEWRELTPPLDELRLRGSSSPFEKEYLRKDGSRVPVLVGVAVLDDDRVLTVVTDLTEQKQAEDRKAAVVDAALDAVVGMDASGAITEFNPAAERTFGYARIEVIGRSLADTLIPERLREAHRLGLARYLASGDAVVIGRRLELQALRRDGSEMPVELSISRVAGPRKPAFVGFIRDISERKRVERALFERMRLAALGADVGIALTASESLAEILRSCCQAVVRHLGPCSAGVWVLGGPARRPVLEASATSADDVGGVPALAALTQLDVGFIAEARRPYVAPDVGALPRFGVETLGVEGASFSAHPLLVGGEAVGVIAILAYEPPSDVAMRGLVSIANAVAVRIHGKVAEQANVGLEEQLRQSQKMEAVGRLAGGVAHDFNNLLSVVLSYSELLLEDLPLDAPAREDVEEIRRAGVRAADLTRQLLMFSRQQVIEPKVLDLNEVLAGMDKMLRRVVGEDIELTSLPAASLGRVNVDPGSIEQVVMNLAINARDAMPTGGKLTLETANVVLDDAYVKSHLGASPGPYVMLSVTDSGSGMDKATVARIFEPFFTTKELGKGTGLGLSTVIGIVQQSRGTIWVYSEIGVGTTFKVYLPLVDAVPQIAAADVVPATIRGSEVILLVEDEAQVRDVARGILLRHGYTVLAASYGEEALAIAARHPGPIHLLLSDVVMPKMSGPELARRLGAVRPGIAVLCMSGYTDDSALRHGVIEAEIAYLQKPLTVEGLTRKVREVLDARPPGLSPGDR